MSDRELGRVARISGEVRAAGARWEVELQRTLLEEGTARPADAALLDALCRSVSVAGAEPPSDEITAHFAGFEGHRRPRRNWTDAAVAAALLVALGILALGSQALVDPPPPAVVPAIPRLVGPPPLLEHAPQRDEPNRARATADGGKKPPATAKAEDRHGQYFGGPRPE
jgi:hypothetical protein